MVKNAPTNAPTEWKNHWHDYHDPRPVTFRGKVHWAVTKPSSLWKKNDRDKKLSSGTSDRKVAGERKWYIAAKIYQSFDDEIKKLNTPEVKFDQFWQLSQELWVANKHPLKDFFSSFPPIDNFGRPDADDVIRLLHSMNIRAPDSMVELVDDEAQFWLNKMPSMTDNNRAQLTSFYRANDSVLELLGPLDRELTNKFMRPSSSVSCLKILSEQYLAEKSWAGRELNLELRLHYLGF